MHLLCSAYLLCVCLCFFGALEHRQLLHITQLLCSCLLHANSFLVSCWTQLMCICNVQGSVAHLFCVCLCFLGALEHHQLLCITKAQAAVRRLTAAGNLLPAGHAMTTHRKYGQPTGSVCDCYCEGQCRTCNAVCRLTTAGNVLPAEHALTANRRHCQNP